MVFKLLYSVRANFWKKSVRSTDGRPQIMSNVLVTHSTYDTCREAVDRAFECFPIDMRGKRVALKMNALKAGDPDRYAYVTN